jgi:hypothetical protein
MNEDAYLRYAFDQRFRVPVLPDAYILEYRINGQVGRWPESGQVPHPLAQLARA